MEIWTLVAALAAALFAGINLFRAVLLDCSRAEAEISNIGVKLTITNPSKSRIYIDSMRLRGATFGIDNYNPSKGTGLIGDSGQKTNSINREVPACGQIVISRYWIQHGQFRYAKASLYPASLWKFGREYNVIVRLIP